MSFLKFFKWAQNGKTIIRSSMLLPGCDWYWKLLLIAKLLFPFLVRIFNKIVLHSLFTISGSQKSKKAKTQFFSDYLYIHMYVKARMAIKDDLKVWSQEYYSGWVKKIMTILNYFLIRQIF